MATKVNRKPGNASDLKKVVIRLQRFLVPQPDHPDRVVPLHGTLDARLFAHDNAFVVHGIPEEGRNCKKSRKDEIGRRITVGSRYGCWSPILLQLKNMVKTDVF